MIRGAIFDVAVDVRRSSPTFGRWFGVELSEDNHLQMWVPTGFAHGFFVTSAMADVSYKCTAPYVPTASRSIAWNDPDIGIAWPWNAPLLSPQDQRGAAAQGRAGSSRRLTPTTIGVDVTTYR